MEKRSSAAYLALFIGLSVALAGCGYMNQVRAMKAFKDGNKAYGASDWRVAVANYEEAAQLTANDPHVSGARPSISISAIPTTTCIAPLVKASRPTMR